MVSEIYSAAKGVPEGYDIFFVSSRHVETVVLMSHKKAGDFISVKMKYKDDNYRQLDRMTYIG
jgi:hypothetical protein